MHNTKTEISQKAARNICILLTATELFFTIVIDGWRYRNSAWICIVSGFILATPAIVISYNKSIKETGTARFLCGAAGVYFTYRTAAVIRLIVNSVSYSNLENTSPLLLSVIMAIVCLYTVSKNSSGIGNAIKILAIPAGLLFLIVFAANVKYMEPRWLAPVISCDYKDLLNGTLSAAGSISAVSIINLLPYNKPFHNKRSIICIAIGAEISLLLCLYTAILTPMQTEISLDRLKIIEQILSNGRTSLGVQLPITLLWFGGFIAATASYAFVGTVFFQKAFPSADSRITTFLSVAIAFAMANTGCAESSILMKINLFVYAGTGVFIILCTEKRRRRDEAYRLQTCRVCRKSSLRGNAGDRLG